VSDVIKNVFNTATAPTRKKAYRHFVAQCHESLLRPCSYAAFCAEARRLGSTVARFGKRIAYQLEPIVWYLIATEAIHGVRPFEYVHIDHTELDLVVIDAYNKKSLGKAWLTLAIDAESRAIVGFYLTFEQPSYRSFMMVLRDIVRRHGRLPGSFIVDNGKEFHSEDFKRVCALLGIHVKFRPAGKPRHGSVMERVFRTTNQQFIHNLAGNTKLMRHVRMVTKSVHPTQFASWTLAALAAGLDYYFGTLYGTEPHPAHGDGPDAHLRRRLSETGLRLNRLARLSRTFLIETCPMVDRKGTRVVDAPAARLNSSIPGRVKIPHRCDGVMDDYASA
jgi:putative transposase